MDSSNYTNCHEQLGVGDNSPTSKQNPRGPGDFGNDVMDVPPHAEKTVESRGNYYNSGTRTQGSSSIRHTGNDAKWNTVASTEIGDPNGRVPTARDTREQLAIARSTELSAEASRTAPGPPRSGHGDVALVASPKVREHRNSNYAPGYEGAAEAVHHRSHKAADHHPSLLSHEPVTPLTEVPPDIHSHPCERND